jgi:hypothetical protein
MTLSPEIRAMLSSTGCTAGLVADRLGIGVRQAGRLLRAEGYTNRSGRYFAPGVARGPWGGTNTRT